MVNFSKLSALKGEHTYYLYTASSQSLMKEELNFADLWKVRGESVAFEKEAYEGGMYALNDDLAKVIADQYGAEIYFFEDVGGVTSYYAYTPDWDEKIILYGFPVNLHIALSETRVAVGTPIIFGGF